MKENVEDQQRITTIKDKIKSIWDDANINISIDKDINIEVDVILDAEDTIYIYELYEDKKNEFKGNISFKLNEMKKIYISNVLEEKEVDKNIKINAEIKNLFEYSKLEKQIIDLYKTELCLLYDEKSNDYLHSFYIKNTNYNINAITGDIFEYTEDDEAINKFNVYNKNLSSVEQILEKLEATKEKKNEKER